MIRKRNTKVRDLQKLDFLGFSFRPSCVFLAIFSYYFAFNYLEYRESLLYSYNDTFYYTATSYFSQLPTIEFIIRLFFLRITQIYFNFETRS